MRQEKIIAPALIIFVFYVDNKSGCCIFTHMADGTAERENEIMTTATLSEKAAKFLAKNPTLIGIVAGYKFYEHPELGDEAPLLMLTPDGKIKRSDFWELPDLIELMESLGMESA